ncbi:MAG: restriction endonuclease subunit S [Alphaproteobacteria bacterium]
MSWSEQTLGELMDEEGGLIQTGPFGSQLKQSEYQEFGIPVIMPTNIHDGQIDQTNIARISDIKSNQLSRHHVRAHTIVLPRRGEISKRAYIRPEQEGWLCGTGCLKIEPQGIKIHPRFLYYFMDTPNAIDWLLKNAVGSTMLNLSAKILNRFPVKYPEIEEQKHIASILSAYDDLIENNQRRISLLEESARLLYREWFVHLRFPGYATTKIIDGVPEGWRKQTLGDVVTTNPESYKKGKLPDTINYIDISSVSTGQINYKTEMSGLEAPGRARRIAKHGDVIWSNVRPNLRAYSMVLKPHERDVFSTGFTVLRAKEISHYFLYFHATSDQFVEYLINYATGTSYPAVRPEDFERADVLLPSDKLSESFDNFCSPIFDQISALSNENDFLSKARDHLLPRLMDGRVEV